VTKIGILGGTGYAGGNIAHEAVSRDHEVVVIARSLPAAEDQLAGVTYRTGDAYDGEFVSSIVGELDCLVLATKADGPDGTDVGTGVLPHLIPALIASGTRLGVVGGGASLQSHEGGPRRVDTPEVIPEQFRNEAIKQAAVLGLLRESAEGLDWFYVSPGHAFGPWNPGTRTGSYRVGGEVKLVDADGKSDISGADLAVAFLDEIETPAHARARFTVAY
jgi:putative NADH-flavin reductase